MEFIIKGMGSFFGLFLENTQFVEALLTAIMNHIRWWSKRMMLNRGANVSQIIFVGKLTSTLQGSTETTYVLAVYFGSVGIRNIRYAVLDYLLILLGSFWQLLLLMYFGDK